MEKNYSAWQIQEKNFPSGGSVKEKIKFILGYAILSPSSHNSQPWETEINNNNLKIKYSQSRLLPHGDPDGKLRNLAIGAFTRTFEIAANHFGLGCNIQLFPGEKNVIADIGIYESAGVQKWTEDGLEFIVKRTTNRNFFKPNKIDSELFQKISILSDQKINVKIFSEKNDIYKIIEVVERGVEKAMKNKNFRKELSRYKKHNLTSSFVGMPGFDMGYSLFFSIIFPYIIKFFPIAPLVKVKDRKLLLDGTPNLVIISTATNSPIEQVSAGSMLVEIMLIAEKFGAATHFMAAAIYDNEISRQLGSVLGIQGIPQGFLRIGYSEKKPLHSPRLPVDKIIKYE